MNEISVHLYGWWEERVGNEYITTYEVLRIVLEDQWACGVRGYEKEPYLIQK